MRISYNDDEDYPGQFALWRANTRRALMGAKGQAVLRQLEKALVDLPAPRLISGHLVKNGDVCTVGALLVERHVSLGEAREAALARFEEPRTCGNCYHDEPYHADGPCAICAQAQVEWPTMVACTAFVPKDYDYEDDADSATVAKADGVPWMVAWRLVELNDEFFDNSTPEDRYTKVLAWTRSHLAGRMDWTDAS